MLSSEKCVYVDTNIYFFFSISTKERLIFFFHLLLVMYEVVFNRRQITCVHDPTSYLKSMSDRHSDIDLFRLGKEIGTRQFEKEFFESLKMVVSNAQLSIIDTSSPTRINVRINKMGKLVFSCHMKERIILKEEDEEEEPFIPECERVPQYSESRQV